jgi:hypothetical protein
VAKTTEDPMVAKAFDKAKHDELEAAVKNLSQEEAQFFLSKLEAAVRKRKIQITGYLVAMFVWLGGMLFALAWYGTHDGFVGWAFLVPFGLVGVILYAFGRYAERVAASPKSPTKPVVTE